MKATNKCMTRGCSCKIIRARGLCNKCYQSFQYRVRRNELTWDDAENAGMCRPLIKGTAPASDAIEKLRKMRQVVAKKEFA